LVPTTDSTTALYIHWPWCRKKCPYCDFNSHVADSLPEEVYVDALLAELAATAPLVSKKLLTSVFFGGGTPSLMSPASVNKLLLQVQKTFPFAPEAEITLEANPTSSDGAKFAAFAAAGVNRFSIGVQSLTPENLALLGREHSVDDALRTVEAALKVVPNVNLDVIYGLPGQSVKSWVTDLSQVTKLGTPHLSAYQLTLEPGTVFYTDHLRGKFSLPDDDTQADFYAATTDTLATAGYTAYEVSNYAKPGAECRHNRHIWRYGDYMGVGAGAHGRLTHPDGTTRATRNLKLPRLYMESVQKGELGRAETVEITPAERPVEMLLMTLRLNEGLNLDHFAARTGIDFSRWVNTPGLALMTRLGYVATEGRQLRVTPPGRPLLDGVIEHLIPDNIPESFLSAPRHDL
jgi:putative oxygen-independent coproporphyrinogen III oxidase